ncbi:MAG: NAD(P)/FAD-dependent oxidoreductase [Phenylobacterium sp.]|nr:MAG: NAD(P)/FAD-dependent oxidoreductase [Phenylobacterium sp.]
MSRDGLNLDFDPDALRRKYEDERAKRVRPDGIRQYHQVDGKLSYFHEDPYSERVEREPLEDEVEVLVIGGGWAGLMTAAKLTEAGYSQIRIVEQGGDFGGAFYWNRYPGLMCDIESYCYMPLLEETGYVPSKKYAYQPEIQAHARRIGRRYDLYRLACFQTKVTEVRWGEADNTWTVRTNRGDVLRAGLVVVSIGPLDKPKLPGIPGIETFKGRSFHSARWDYGYTGGDPDGNMSKLADKRVAILGTGTSAVQCIPHLGRDAGHLYVLQRTPAVVRPRSNTPTDPDWAKSLEPGWQRQRMANFNTIITLGPIEEDVVNDGWTDMFKKLGGTTLSGRTGAPGQMTADEMARATELLDFEYMEETRALIDEVVKDPATAQALKPWYRTFCKRPAFNDDYLATFNRPNVTLVDTNGQGPDRISEKGVVFDGVEYEVDCIIYASGFEYTTPFAQRSGFEIYGRGGQSLTDHWSKGMRTLHGFYSHGFPNLFHVGVSQGAFGVNLPYNYLEQAEHVTAVIQHARLHQKRVIEPSVDGEAQWVATIHEKEFTNREFLETCTPGYLNGEGRAEDGVWACRYGGGPHEFYALLKTWRDDGEMQGLAFAD